MKPWLIIGGTGSLGKKFTEILFKDSNPFPFSRLRIMSRGEHRQMEMEKEFQGEPIDFFVGDVRDRDRVEGSVQGCSMVFHFAAMKSVDKAEYDPMEAVKTNILGTQNVIDACHIAGVERAFFTSTDKAVSPLNLYGATKLVAEKLWIQGNIGSYITRFSAARYGNILGSQGSVVSKWREGPPYKITHPEMTRFFMTQETAARFILDRSREAVGGEIFIPKMKSTLMGDLLDVVAGQTTDYEVIGIRPGEKWHEALISPDESHLVTDMGEYWIRWPSHQLYPFYKRGKPLDRGQSFTSETAGKFTPTELREMCDE